MEKYKDDVLEKTLHRSRGNMSSVRKQPSKKSGTKSEITRLFEESLKSIGGLPKVSKQDKIDYCDFTYGEGNWFFMSRDEVKASLKRDGVI